MTGSFSLLALRPAYTCLLSSCFPAHALPPICCPQALLARLRAYGLATAPDACSLWHVAGAAALPDEPPARRISVLLWQLVSGVAVTRCGGAHAEAACMS